MYKVTKKEKCISINDSLHCKNIINILYLNVQKVIIENAIELTF